MDKVSKQCAECGYNLFVHYNKNRKKYYCQICNPDRIHQGREPKADEDVKEEFYKKKLKDKNKEIRKLKRQNKKLRKQLNKN